MSLKVYSSKTHSISRNTDCESSFSLTINFFEMEFDLFSHKIVDVYGYFPLVKASKENIILPKYVVGDYIVKLVNDDVENGGIYEYNNKAYTRGTSFQNNSICIDYNKKIISVGDIKYKGAALRVNNNIICVVDSEGILRCLYIILDLFSWESK